MKILLVTLGLAMVGSGPAAAASTRGAGVGVVVGDPIGAVMRTFLNDVQSVDVGVGYSGDAVLWADFAWHSWDLFPKARAGLMDAWVSAGPRLETRRDAEFAVRTLLGLSCWVPRQPIEVFITAGPVFRLAPKGGVDADGGVGLRFYFGGEPQASKR